MILCKISVNSVYISWNHSILQSGNLEILISIYTCRYIDDILPIHNTLFDNYLVYMYPNELEIKDTIESKTFASSFAFYLDLILSTSYSLSDKHDFNFHITNFQFLSSNVPFLPAYGVFISRLIQCACFSNEYFLLSAKRLSSKFLGQGYTLQKK